MGQCGWVPKALHKNPAGALPLLAVKAFTCELALEILPLTREFKTESARSSDMPTTSTCCTQVSRKNGSPIGGTHRGSPTWTKPTERASANTDGPESKNCCWA